MLKWVLVCGLLLFCLHHDQQARARDRARDTVLDVAGDALARISSNSQNAIPDSVLNAAKCFIVVPSLPRGTGEISAPAVASCRDGSDWRAPLSLIFSGRLGQQAPAVLLVLVMTDKGASAVRARQITIQKRQGKAPLVSTAPILTQFDLTSDYMTYEASDTGMLAASGAAGSFRASQSTLGPPGGTSAAKYEASLQSFVNTIVPTGIVIHHTAFIGSEKLPSGERDVDRYHQQRGFQIYCSGRVYHVAYHYLILPDGRVQHGRPERCEGAHARGYNAYLGISVIGDFSTRDDQLGKKRPKTPTAKQLNAMVKLCRMLRQKYKIPLQHVLRHSDIASTDCPGDRFPFDKFMQRLKAEDTRAVSKR
ncbi:MAG: N-acetylmuramoyl-L-alanine amidase family 2 [Acidobacteriaceae bacterium]|jgi:N-acetylmuramoyl-L-alanine amidase|nr:N-acetylmuramoyl-L-alanine amidase family 2 [Acidobacteriaceae bacterium]